MNIDHIIEKARELLTKTASGPQLDTPEALAQSVLQAIIEGPDGWSVNVERLKRLLGDRAVTDPTKDFGLVWSGRAEAMEAHRVPTYTSLRPVEARSVNFETTENLYIEGDNLRALKLLLPKYHDRVKVIYIDPPYNTGKDFIYPDDFRDFSLKTNTVKSADKLEANLETSSFYHSKWLSMMWPRLKLAKEFLTEDGVIFISIDDHEAANLRLLCDGIFGAENFLAQVVWERAYAPITLKKHFSPSHDYIVAYAKNISSATCNGIPRTTEADARYKNPDNDPRGPWMSSDISVGPAVEDRVYPVSTPSGRVVWPASGRCWSMTQEEMQNRMADNRIWFGADGDGVPRIKRFLSEVKQGLTPMTVWRKKKNEKTDDDEEASEVEDMEYSQDATKALKKLFGGKSYFDYPKPVPLIKRCIALYGGKDDIIMDFFSGSATTAHAVMEMNAQDGGARKYIMVQLPEPTPEDSEAAKDGLKNICEIAQLRIKLAAEAILEKYPDAKDKLDVGFRVLEVAEPLANAVCEKSAAEWAEADALLFDAEPLNPNVTANDLLFNALMQSEAPLTATLRQETIAGLAVWCAYEGALLRLVAYVQDVANTFPVEQAKWLAFVEALAKRTPLPEHLFIPQACFSEGSACQINVRNALEPAGIKFLTL